VETLTVTAWLAKMMVYSMLVDPRVNLCP